MAEKHDAAYHGTETEEGIRLLREDRDRWRTIAEARTADLRDARQARRDGTRDPGDLTAQPKPTAAEPGEVTTDYVRTVYARCPVDSLNGGRPNPTPHYAARQFDRWLAEHDAQVLRDAAQESPTEAVKRYGHGRQWLHARADRIAGGAG